MAMMDRELGLRGCAALAAAVAMLSGCRTPEAWRQNADAAAERTIAEFQDKALGETEPFEVERPSDTLRRRLMIEQNLPSYTNRFAELSEQTGAIVLDRIGCLQVAARNSKEYQEQKESVFETALALDLERDVYRNTWSGIVSALFSSDRSGGETESSVEGGFNARLSRKLKSGAVIVGKLGVDIIQLLTLDESSSYGLLADATITIPLMRGSGRAVATESLTQAERNMIYSLWNFDRFRRSFSVEIVSGYFSVLQSEDELRNAAENVGRLEDSLLRSEELARAGRMPELQVDQTRQDLLRARTRRVAARQSWERQLDSFKQTLGLPVDARIELESDELERIERPDLEGEGLPSESELIISAFGKRRDLRIVFERVRDAERQLMVARDALRMGLEFKAAASTRERRYQGSDSGDLRFENGSFTSSLEFDLPWERTNERNAYRLQIIACDRARRDLEQKEDSVKAEVRNSLRNLEQARQNYIIQSEALKLARARTESTQLFMDAGRASTRDLLEAEDALISAKNALTAALTSYRISQLELMSDTGTLDIGEEWELEF